MRNIGKIAVLAMTLSLAGVLTACGDSGSASSAASSAASAASSAAASSAAVESSTVASSAAAESASAKAASTEDNAAAKGKSEVTVSASAEAEATVGTGGEYRNDYFGIMFEKPDDWVFATDEEVAAANEAAGAVEGGAKIDMMALAPDKSMKVTVSVMPKSEEIASMTPEEHLDASVAATKESVEKSDNYTFEVEDVSFDFEDGSSLPAKIINATVDGASLCTFQECAEKDGVFFDVLIEGHDEDSVVAAAKYFKLLKN